MNIRASMRQLFQPEPEQYDHLRLQDIGSMGEKSLEDSSDHTQKEPEKSGDLAPEFKSKLDKSMARLERNAQKLAEALTALDEVDAKLSRTRANLQDLADRGAAVDGHRVAAALSAIARATNEALSGLDGEETNLLRDLRVKIQFDELGGRGSEQVGISLTVISVEKFLGLTGDAAGRDTRQWLDHVDRLVRIVQNNIHILSSLLLALFASRDYTSDVVNFARSHNALPLATRRARFMPRAVHAASGLDPNGDGQACDGGHGSARPARLSHLLSQIDDLSEQL